MEMPVKIVKFQLNNRYCLARFRLRFDNQVLKKSNVEKVNAKPTPFIAPMECTHTSKFS